jgi:flotillin
MSHERFSLTGSHVAAGCALGAAGLAAGFLTRRWFVCAPHQYLVRTGLGIKNMAISRQGIQWPFQQARFVSMQPRSLRFDLKCLSKQYLPFVMPVTYTVRPMNPETNADGFKVYAENMVPLPTEEFEQTILGVVHGETRVQAAQMDIDRINDDRELFREKVVQIVQDKLNDLGLEIVNANIAELTEDERSGGQMGYLQARERRKLAQAIQQSEVDVADATRDGDIGKKERERDTRIQVAAMDAAAIAAENTNRADIARSTAELAVVQASSDREAEVARIEAKMAAQQREVELQRELNVADRQQELERRRAATLTESRVKAESLIAQSEGDVASIQMLADARLYEQEQRAKGIQSVYAAQADGLQHVHDACGRDAALTKFYLALDTNLYPKLAEENAKAVQNLNPKINVWHTGGSGGGGGGKDGDSAPDPMSPILRVVQSMAPMLQGLQDQGGVTMPDWMPRMSVTTTPEEGCVRNASDGVDVDAAQADDDVEPSS